MKIPDTSMKHLRVCVWNDSEAKAGAWALIMREDGFDTVVHSSLADPPAFAAFVADYHPDVVVLDILNDTSNQAQGLEMASAIREADVLVPLVAVTRDPTKIYAASTRIEELGFAGIYHDSVMARGSVQNLAIRHSLYNWHSLAPEYVLVRACIHAVLEEFGGKQEDYLPGLVSTLERLPLSLTIESWHTQLCSTLASIMHFRSLGGMKSRFETIVELFQTADPYFMAATSARRHLSHNVQVFLLGLTILLDSSTTKSSAINSLRNIRPSEPSSALLADAVVIWGCIAATHDVAYLRENLPRVIRSLINLGKRFAPALSAPPDIEAEIGPAQHHAVVGAALWDDAAISDPAELAYCKMIARGIQRHDSKQSGVTPVSSADWASFLAVLCDELQDWGRDRPEDPNIPWRLFTLQLLHVQEATQITPAIISLEFIARDHPKLVGEFIDRQGPTGVQKRFRSILETLRRNLRSTPDLEVRLAAHFVSREVEPCKAAQVLSTTGC